MKFIDKVHIEVRAYAKRGYRIILIGHAGHDEVVGTLGQAPKPSHSWKPWRTPNGSICGLMKRAWS